jgi:predicted DNA-binding protein
MEVRFTAETEKTIRQLAADSGQATDDIVEDAMVAYIKKLGDLRQTLDSRYDDIKSGKVKLISGDEIEAYFAQKGNSDREHSGS